MRSLLYNRTVYVLVFTACHNTQNRPKHRKMTDRGQLKIMHGARYGFFKTTLQRTGSIVCATYVAFYETLPVRRKVGAT